MRAGRWLHPGQSVARIGYAAGMIPVDGSRRYRVRLAPVDGSDRGALPSIRPGGKHPLCPAVKAIAQRSAFARALDPVCKAARQYREQHSAQTALPH